MVVVKWYWAGDSVKGTQDKWITYDEATSEKLEEFYQDKRRKKYDIDTIRYVDMSNRTAMVQRRYDDPEKRRAVKRELEDSDSSDDDDDYVVWYWAGDSKAGKADTQMEYDPKTCRKIESSFSKGNKTLKLDDLRYIDFTHMVQKRYDDTSKQRAITREKKRKKSYADGGSKKKKLR